MAVPGRISAGRGGPAESPLPPDENLETGREPLEKKLDEIRSALAKGQIDMTAITSEKSKLGFVGVGYMGRPIAQRLLESGFKVVAYDRHRSKAEELIQYGGTVAASVVELSSSCDVVLSCLASDEAVLHVYGGADGAFANARRGALVIDLSTVNPKTSQELSRLGSERGVDVLDATISGSTPAAEQGALTLFGGGDQGCFAAAESIFRVIARKYFYLGPSGSNHEAGREHPVGNRDAGNCRGRCAR